MVAVVWFGGDARTTGLLVAAPALGALLGSVQLWLGLVMLALAGCADSVSMVFRNTMLQAAVPDEMRGRLQGVFIVVAGGPRLGDLVAGSVADLTSPAVAVTGGGLACVLAVCLLAVWRRGFARYDARDPQP